MKEKDKSTTAIALKQELTASILQKVSAIEKKIKEGSGESDKAYLQMLLMIDEDLDDVLLNWEYDSISSRRIDTYSDEFDELGL